MTKRNDKLKAAIATESRKFEAFYRWIENHMPPAFFAEVGHKSLIMLTHNLMEFDLQGFFSHINTKEGAFSLALDSPDADLRILSVHKHRHIRNYRSFVSNAPLPFSSAGAPLRIATITFTKPSKEKELTCSLFHKEDKLSLLEKLQEICPGVSFEDLEILLSKLNTRFLRAIPNDRLVSVLALFFRAKQRDNCQYEIRTQEKWEEEHSPSLQILFAWRGLVKRNFFFRIAELIHRHKLAIKRINAINIDPYSEDSVLVVSIALHGIEDKAAWEVADIDDLLKELVTLKFFEGMPLLETTYLQTGLLSGNLTNFLKASCSFIHQALIHYNVHAYSFEHIEEGLCRHPEIVLLFIEAFTYKFHPKKHHFTHYEELLALAFEKVEHLDTGNELNDTRRKNVLNQLGLFIEYTLKTNFYRNNKSALCFRLDPKYLEKLPYDRKQIFPSIPFAIYFMKGFHFLGFHIRFQDLARGGLRTVIPKSRESMLYERNNVFLEAYNLSYTQQKKNKDIPEGGAKAIIFLEPFEALEEELTLLQEEFLKAGFTLEEVEKQLKPFAQGHTTSHLYQSQRAFIESLMTLINYDENGVLRLKDIVDYWKKPEYIYLGPDENMHNKMIEWIASYSKQRDYKLGIAFISSKPKLGFNHKELGVTSAGINVYAEKVLYYLGIDPYQMPFSVKMTGGPDGDVAGNEMVNLLHFYPNTAKLLTTIDVSGTVFDEKGLDLQEIKTLFLESKPIGDYPLSKISPGGFLLDTRVRKQEERGPILTLCTKNKEGTIVKEWISSSAAQLLLRKTVHKTIADIFIPGGGRPRTLHKGNIHEFLDAEGRPTAKAIVEGANLYITEEGRAFLEDLGVLIIRDSSANKGGVICSSFEVLANLCLSEEEFLEEKKHLINDTLLMIKQKAASEADLLLATHLETKKPLTQISEEISKAINSYTDRFLEELEKIALSLAIDDPINQALLAHCLPTLRMRYPNQVLNNIPPIHKKAIIASFLAAKLVYCKGLSYSFQGNLHDLLLDNNFMQSIENQ